MPFLWNLRYLFSCCYFLLFINHVFPVEVGAGGGKAGAKASAAASAQSSSYGAKALENAALLIFEGIAIADLSLVKMAIEDGAAVNRPLDPIRAEIDLKLGKAFTDFPICPPIHFAINYGDKSRLAIARYLMESANADANAFSGLPPSTGRSFPPALLYAMGMGQRPTPSHAAVFQSLYRTLPYRFNLSSIDNWRRKTDSPPFVHMCIALRNFDCLYLAITELDAPFVNEVDRFGWTALHYATWYGDTQTIIFLIHNGANLAAKDHRGLQPIHIAILRRHVEAIALLLGSALEAKKKYKTSKLLTTMLFDKVNLWRTRDDGKTFEEDENDIDEDVEVDVEHDGGVEGRDTTRSGKNNKLSQDRNNYSRSPDQEKTVFDLLLTKPLFLEGICALFNVIPDDILDKKVVRDNRFAVYRFLWSTIARERTDSLELEDREDAGDEVDEYENYGSGGLNCSAVATFKPSSGLIGSQLTIGKLVNSEEEDEEKSKSTREYEVLREFWLSYFVPGKPVLFDNEFTRFFGIWAYPSLDLLMERLSDAKGFDSKFSTARKRDGRERYKFLITSDEAKQKWFTDFWTIPVIDRICGEEEMEKGNDRGKGRGKGATDGIHFESYEISIATKGDRDFQWRIPNARWTMTIFGEREILLLGPEATDSFPFEDNYELDTSAILRDLESNRTSQATVVRVKRGEVLFIPPFWSIIDTASPNTPTPSSSSSQSIYHSQEDKLPPVSISLSRDFCSHTVTNYRVQPLGWVLYGGKDEKVASFGSQRVHWKTKDRSHESTANKEGKDKRYPLFQ